MASLDERRRPGRDVLAAVIPLRRDPSDAAVRADDKLVEMIRSGRVPSVVDPLVRRLVAWRAGVNRPW